jgi:hypothetical protein
MDRDTGVGTDEAPNEVEIAARTLGITVELRRVLGVDWSQRATVNP